MDILRILWFRDAHCAELSLEKRYKVGGSQLGMMLMFWKVEGKGTEDNPSSLQVAHKSNFLRIPVPQAEPHLHPLVLDFA